MQIGDELVELMNYFTKPFTDTLEYIYNNPLKFIINKLWEKYYNVKSKNPIKDIHYLNEKLLVISFLL